MEIPLPFTKVCLVIGEHIKAPTELLSVRVILGLGVLLVLILFTLTPIIIWTEPNQFSMFFHRNLRYGITGVS